MDTDLPDEMLDPAAVGGMSEHLLDDSSMTCTLCGRPLGFSTDDQPYCDDAEQ